MKEDFVSYDQAVRLKKLGFDWECIAEYAVEPDGKPILVGSTAFVFRNSEEKGRDVAAPSLSHAQKWLREVKGIAINVMAHDGGKYDYDIVFLPNAAECDGDIDRSPWYRAYEGALVDGIDDVLKLLEEKSSSN